MEPQNTGGGTLTDQVQAQGGQAAISDAQFNELNHARRRNQERQADGYLAVMLCTRAGWTPQQTANFLAVHEAAVEAWCSNYRDGGFDSLKGLAPPAIRGT